MQREATSEINWKEKEQTRGRMKRKEMDELSGMKKEERKLRKQKVMMTKREGCRLGAEKKIKGKG